MRRGIPLLLLLVGCGAPPGPRDPVPATVPRVAVVADSTATAVAAALVFPGSAWELPGMEGLTLLAAETLLEQARSPLASLGARANVACGAALFEFTLVAPPESWETALGVLLDALFRPDPGEAALETARRRLSRSLSLDLASPAWQGRLAARQALYGDSLAPSAWEGPPCGVPESLDLFGLDHVRAAAFRFAPRMAVAALNGPLDVPHAVALLERWIPPAGRPPVPSPTRATAGRRYVERNTVTAWTAQAFPFGPDADEEGLRYLGALLEEAVGPDVARPDVYAMTYEIARHGGGGALIVHMITTPERAAAYADRVVERVGEVAGSAVPPAVWNRVARRQRGLRLQEREAPEARAAALARALMLEAGRRVGGSGDGWPELGAVTADRVRDAAVALGAPARAVIGPRTARSAVVP